jgi:hypothetical protein
VLLPTNASQLGDKIGQLSRDRAMPMQPPAAGRERWAAHCRPTEKREIKNFVAHAPPIRYLSHVISYAEHGF